MLRKYRWIILCTVVACVGAIVFNVVTGHSLGWYGFLFGAPFGWLAAMLEERYP